MARPKEFDPNEALERAMLLFWEKGFQATSMRDLVQAMGINRGSLYDTFGSKEELYQAAIDRYCDEQTAGMIDMLSAPGEPKDVLERVFQRALE